MIESVVSSAVCVCESDRRRRRSDRIRRLGVGRFRARARQSPRPASAFGSRSCPPGSASRCSRSRRRARSRASRSRAFGFQTRDGSSRVLEPARERVRLSARLRRSRLGRRDAARQRRRLRLLKRRQSALQGTVRESTPRSRVHRRRIVRGVPRVQPRGAVNGAAQAVGGNGELSSAESFMNKRKRIRLVAERRRVARYPRRSR